MQLRLKPQKAEEIMYLRRKKNGDNVPSNIF